MKTDKLMNEKEAKQARVLELLKENKISQQDASVRLGITTRQVRRLTKRYQATGLAGLASKKRGKVSNRRLDEAIYGKTIDLIGAYYRNLGPTQACKKLAELHGIQLSVESTRQIMIQAGYWLPKMRGTACAHPVRERRARFGELIQIAGSPHDWLESRGDYCTLLVFIDDATGRITQLRFAPTETTLSYMHVLHNHILMYGVPATLYSDKHSIFSIDARAPDSETETQFSRVARELGIECIHAHSPQAEGRAKRVIQTLQNSLVKEMRLANINDIDSANAWLPDYITKFNRRFSVAPKDTSDAHQAYIGARVDLLHTLPVQITKILSINLARQHENQAIQVSTADTEPGLPGEKVTANEHCDDTQALFWKKLKLTYGVIYKPQPSVADSKSAQADEAMVRRSAEHKPAANHPWRKMAVGKSAHDGHRTAT